MADRLDLDQGSWEVTRPIVERLDTATLLDTAEDIEVGRHPRRLGRTNFLGLVSLRVYDELVRRFGPNLKNALGAWERDTLDRHRSWVDIARDVAYWEG
jgi:hypothetical protein